MSRLNIPTIRWNLVAIFRPCDRHLTMISNIISQQTSGKSLVQLSEQIYFGTEVAVVKYFCFYLKDSGKVSFTCFHILLKWFPY